MCIPKKTYFDRIDAQLLKISPCQDITANEVILGDDLAAILQLSHKSDGYQLSSG